MSDSKRIEWLDLAKGVGILLVVFSHVYGYGIMATRCIEWFYMPMFFLISGFLYKGPAPFRPFFVKRVQHLLLPYASFVGALGLVTYVSYRLLYAVPDPSWRYLGEYAWRLIYGGKALGGVFGYLGRPFGICWFLTCLFGTQILYNEIYKRLEHHRLALLAVMAGMYALAMLDSRTRFMTGAFNDWGWAWNINVVAFAIVFFYIGHHWAMAMRSGFWQSHSAPLDTALLVFAVGGVFAALILQIAGILTPSVSVKFARYGVPVYSLAVALAMILLTYVITQAWARCADLTKTAVQECGKASMVIMYMHSCVQFTMLDYPATANKHLRFVFSVAVSYCLYRIFLLFPLTRRLFLGMASRTQR